MSPSLPKRPSLEHLKKSAKQLLVALHHGFASWESVRHHLSADRTTNAHSLEDVIGRCPHEIPEYAGLQQWLQSVAEQLTGRARDLGLTAAKHYGQAFEYYDRFRLLLKPS